MNKELVPELRFPEFSGEWEEKKLGEVVSFKKGIGIPKKDLSEVGRKCILYGELYTTYNEIIEDVYSRTELDINKLRFGKKGDILIPSSGETALDMSLASTLLLDDIALGGDINILTPNKGYINSIFLSYQINSARKTDLAKIAEGASVVHLYNSNLKEVSIYISKLKEQEKIGKFFYSIDKKLELQEKKIANLKEYKKAMMQRIFSQEIRFKDEDGKEYPEWEEKKFKDLLQSTIDNRGKTPPVEQEGIPLLEVNALGGFCPNYSKVSKFVSEKIYSSWFRGHIEKGDLLFTTVGKTGTVSLQDDNIAAIAQNIIAFRFKEANQRFMYYLLTSFENRKKIKRIEMGAVQPSVKVTQMVLLKFLIPIKQEQEKIANFLSSLDKKIQLEEEKLENYKDYKKGLMQRMFI